MKCENLSQRMHIQFTFYCEIHSLCYRLFSGTLVHGLVRYLKAGQVAESLLPGGTLSAQLYSSLLAAVKKCSSKIPQHSSAGQSKRGRQRGRQGRGRGRGGRGACRGRGAIRELDNMFAALMSDEFDDDW